MNTQTATLRELTVRYSVKTSCDGRPVAIGRVLSSPRDAEAVFASLLEDEPTEVFGMLCLSTKHRVIAYYEVSRGTLDSTIVHPRDVFRAAIMANAACIVVSHNHPSGDPTPSAEDHALTHRLMAAGEMLGIEILDHIIVGHGRYHSFKEAGRL